MKRKLSLLLSFVIIATLCLFCLTSCMNSDRDYRFGDYRYTVENEEVTVTKYSGSASDVTVPENIKGMPVVAIGDSAFSRCTNMRSLTIPDSVARIGHHAFINCNALERVTLGQGIREIDFSPFAFCDKMIYNEYENGYYVGNDGNPYVALVSVASHDMEEFTIHPDTVAVCGTAIENCWLLRDLAFPDGVVSIGGFALQYCSSLETVYIPQSVESIGLLAFEDCNSLREIIVSEDNPHFKSVDASLFSRDGTHLIKYAAGREAASYQVPDGTVVIECSAFEEATHLTEVVLPDSVEEIGHSAFIHCENMSSIHLGNTLKRIGGQAFGFCRSLTKITVPNSVEELSYSAFSDCDKLESAVIGSGVIRLDDGVFRGCEALSEVVFRDHDGWKVKTAYAIFSDRVDLSDPKQNADYLTDKYCEYYWFKE